MRGYKLTVGATRPRRSKGVSTKSRNLWTGWMLPSFKRGRYVPSLVQCVEYRNDEVLIDATSPAQSRFPYYKDIMLM